MLESSVAVFGEGQVTYQVCCYNGVDRLRLQHHPRSHRVDKHLINLHLRELLRHISSNLVPEHHAIPLRIALGHHCQHLPRPACRCFKSEAHQPADTVAGKDGDLCGCLPLLASVRATTLPGIFALAVLADDDPVEVAGLAIPERRLGTGQDASGTHVGVLLEGLAYR